MVVRADAEGRIANRLSMADEGGTRTLDGHVIASPDGAWLYTGETDRQTGEGWVSVRDVRNLRKVAEHRTHGIDPHLDFSDLDEIKRTVFSAIEALPEDLRTAITLRELEGLSYEEIAEIMDCPVGTVRSRIFRAREAIDKKLQPLIEN